MLALCVLGFGFQPLKQMSWLVLPRHIGPREPLVGPGSAAAARQHRSRVHN